VFTTVSTQPTCITSSIVNANYDSVRFTSEIIKKKGAKHHFTVHDFGMLSD